MGKRALKKQIIALENENKVLKEEIAQMWADLKGANEFAVEMQRLSTYVCRRCALKYLCKNYWDERTICASKLASSYDDEPLIRLFKD